MSRRGRREVDPTLRALLVERFTAQVFAHADLPRAREEDVRGAPEFWIQDDGSTIGVTCTITGSRYEAPWDGSEEAAIALVDEAALVTAELVTETEYYAWIWSTKA